MAFFFILTGVILRLLPHLPNFAPIAAMALFGGTYLNRRYALVVPLIALLIGDIFIGFYSPWIMLSVYGSFALIGLIGIWLKNHKNVPNVIGGTLMGSIIFFLVTNFACWVIPHSFYPHTWQGLMQSFIMGLPFFRNTLMGDLFYVGAMFGLYELVLWVTSTWGFKKERDGFHFRKLARKKI